MIFSTAPAEAPRDEVLQRTAVVQDHGITVDPHLGALEMGRFIHEQW